MIPCSVVAAYWYFEWTWCLWNIRMFLSVRSHSITSQIMIIFRAKVKRSKFYSWTHRSPSTKDDLQVCTLLSDTHSILSVSHSIQIFYTEDQNLHTSENDNLNLHVQSFRCFPAWSLKFRSLKHGNNNNNNNQINIISSNMVQATFWLSPSSWVLGYPIFGIYSYNNFGMHISSNLNKCHVHLCAQRTI